MHLDQLNCGAAALKDWLGWFGVGWLSDGNESIDQSTMVTYPRRELYHESVTELDG
jgi:hypothetical protein